MAQSGEQEKRENGRVNHGCMPVYWGIFAGSNFRGFHGYYVIIHENQANEKFVEYRMGMIACACEHYTVNLTPLKFFTVMYIQLFVHWLVYAI